MCLELAWHIFNLWQECAYGQAIMQTFCVFIKLEENQHVEHTAVAAGLWVCFNYFMQLHLHRPKTENSLFINM